MELSLAFSPCPNDTFAFHAMINRLVDTEGLAFKLSYHAFFGRTAPLLLQTAYPCCTNLQPMLFSEIEGAGLRDEADAGVLIREGTFTYKDKGLELIRDLGNFWQESFGLPIPLGGIAVNRRLPEETAIQIGRVLKRSIRYAMDHPEASAAFVMENARELSREIQQEHIRLFVNDYTPDIGEEGKKAVTFLHAKYREGSLFVPVS